MKKLVMLCALMTLAVSAQATSQFALKGSLCEEWNKLGTARWEGKHVKQYEGGVIASIEAAYRVKPNVAVIGSVGFPLETKQTRFSVGVEVNLWSGKLVDP